MRYAHGGGLDAAARARREGVRLQAAQLITSGQGDAMVAWRLRVSKVSANRWRRALDTGGTADLASRGAAGARCRLTATQQRALLSTLNLINAPKLAEGAVMRRTFQ